MGVTLKNAKYAPDIYIYIYIRRDYDIISIEGTLDPFSCLVITHHACVYLIYIYIYIFVV